MDAHEAASLLVSHIHELDGFHYNTEISSTYGHMGAIICDAILQAGMNYQTVVAPRVNRILIQFPTHTRTSEFISLLDMYGTYEILQWRHHEKPRRVRMLAEHFWSNDVEEENDLVEWLLDSGNCETLIDLRGIGPKTIDYLKMLVNIPTIAVDRHIKNFVSHAGIPQTSYEDIRLIVSISAEILDVPHRTLDHAIWEYMALSK